MLLVPRVTKQISLYYYNDNKSFLFYSVEGAHDGGRGSGSSEFADQSTINTILT